MDDSGAPWQGEEVCSIKRMDPIVVDASERADHPSLFSI